MEHIYGVRNFVHAKNRRQKETMGEQNLKLKRKLVIQSFLPLFILIFIRYFDYRMISSICHFIRELMQRNFSVMNRIWDHPYLGPFIAAFISLVCSLYGITAMWQFKSMQMSGFVDAGEEIVIEEEITDSGITFFMTFVLPLLLDDVETLRGFIIFTGILGLVIRLMWTTHLYYQNPILTLLGYRIYKFRFIKKQISDTLDDGVLDFELKIMFPASGSLIKGEMLHGGLHGFHHDKHIKPKFIIRKQFC